MAFEGLESKLMKVSKGDFVFKKGDFTRDLFIIKSGKVRVVKQIGVRTVTFSELKEGSVFGEVAAIDGEPRSASVQAMVDTEVFVISPKEFVKKTASMPDWFFKIAKILVQRLRETDQRIESEDIGSSEYNVALLLSYFAACEGEVQEDLTVLSLEKVKSDMKDLLRVQPEKLKNILEQLRENELVHVSQEKIIVPDVKKLEEHARRLQESLARSIYL